VILPAVHQLTLPFARAPEYRADDFIAAPSNAEARAFLADSGAWPDGRLALVGAQGAGKTHLLHLWAGAGEVWSGPFLRSLPVFSARRIALDDADACPDEAALLHLLNHARETGTLLLLAGRTPPARWPVALPDLASRLRAVVAVAIGAAEDELLAALLARLFAERQLAVSAAIQDFLLTRLPRSPAALREAAARLDRRALALGGRITRALAAEVVGELTQSEISPDERP
jgi:chromosomal replication initiation ATPase DnaA